MSLQELGASRGPDATSRATAPDLLPRANPAAGGPGPPGPGELLGGIMGKRGGYAWAPPEAREQIWRQAQKPNAAGTYTP